MHDFIDDDLGKMVPYGVYDIAANAGCVSPRIGPKARPRTGSGIDNDTAQFAVNSIRRWLDVMGRAQYPAADRVMISAESGGSNGSRVRKFKIELQKLADETGLDFRSVTFRPARRV